MDCGRAVKEEGESVDIRAKDGWWLALGGIYGAGERHTDSGYELEVDPTELGAAGLVWSEGNWSTKDDS